MIAGSDADLCGLGWRRERVGGFCGLRLWFRRGDERAIELDDGRIWSGLPLQKRTVTSSCRVQAGDGWWNSAAGCNHGLGEAGGASFRVEDAHMVGQNSCRVRGKRGGKQVGTGGRAGRDGDAGDGRAGWLCRGIGGGRDSGSLAADLGDERRGYVETVSGTGGSRPVEENAVTNALGGKVGWYVAEVERRRAWWSGAGAACDE